LTEDGFALFFQQRFSRTVILLVTMGASRADAEDATQEAMILAWRQWESIREPTAWVRTVAVRTFWKQANRQANQTEPLEAAAEPTADSDLSIFAEEQQEILRLLRELPTGQRTVAALYYDGLSCDEIAELIGKPPATVRSNLRHARTALREVIVSELPRLPESRS
jgi:RNA polymerase sigma factor (sigma-70 family)